MEVLEFPGQRFPDPRSADPDGLVCVGGNLQVETLIRAYSQGIFPWPQGNLPLLWFSPDPRGVLDFEELHVSRSLNRFLKRNPFHVTRNHCFEEVIRQCALAPRDHHGTWIRSDMVEAYVKLHKAGYGLSVECWNGEQLVGGIYGVWVNDFFSGESMFFLQSNASKVALLELIAWLKEKGLSWMDIQMLTPVLEAMGGKYINQDDFLERIGV